jgi:isoleucyl-tRNA synthetase
MELAQDLSSLILSIRKKVGIRVRQPLQRVMIPVLNSEMIEATRAVEEIVKAEVNVREIQLLTDTEGVIKKRLKPDFKKLGARLGGAMKEVAAALTALPAEQVNILERDGSIDIQLKNGETANVLKSEVSILAEDVPGWSVASNGALTVALDISLTPELLEEGQVREFVNRIQKVRKDSGLELTDRVTLQLEEDADLTPVLMKHNAYIRAEILASDITVGPKLINALPIEIDDAVLHVHLQKAN